jgi:GNAT superfamily N-acetyltransferase
LVIVSISSAMSPGGLLPEAGKPALWCNRCVLESRSTLTAADLEAIAGLERRVLRTDGGRLKLEWNTLRSRSEASVDGLLWWEAGTLLGFLGLYGYGETVELVGMVDPAARRRGIASVLLDAARPLCRERAASTVLLIVPRPSAAGRALALARGATLDHAEHALVLRAAVRDIPHDDAVSIRPAGPEDASTVGRLVDDAFGVSFGEPDERTLVVGRDGHTIGTLRLVPTDTGVGV